MIFKTPSQKQSATLRCRSGPLHSAIYTKQAQAMPTQVTGKGHQRLLLLAVMRLGDHCWALAGTRTALPVCALRRPHFTEKCS